VYKSKLFTAVLTIVLALAGSTATASPTIKLYSVINCNSAIDLPYWATYVDKHFPYYETRDGANWHNGSGTIYGSKILSVFYTASAPYRFVGVILADPPDVVIERIERSRIFPTNVHKSHDYWVGSSGMQIKWHDQRHTKLYCIGVRK
jgi:hypothetical protein